MRQAGESSDGLGAHVRVVQGDLARLGFAVGAVVSSDDNYLSAGGGVSRALLRAAADPAVQREMAAHVRGPAGGAGSRTNSALTVGDVVPTTAGRIDARYILHAVVIDFDTNRLPEAEDIRLAVTRALETASRLGLPSVAFPAIGAGAGRLSIPECAEAMSEGVLDYLERARFDGEVLFVALDGPTRSTFENAWADALARRSRGVAEASCILDDVGRSYPLPIARVPVQHSADDPERELWQVVELCRATLEYLLGIGLACLGTRELAEVAAQAGSFDRMGLGRLLLVATGVVDRLAACQGPIPEMARLAKPVRDLNVVVAVRNRLAHTPEAALPEGEAAHVVAEILRPVLRLLVAAGFLRDLVLEWRPDDGPTVTLMGRESARLLPRDGEPGRLVLRPRDAAGELDLSPWLRPTDGDGSGRWLASPGAAPVGSKGSGAAPEQPATSVASLPRPGTHPCTEGRRAATPPVESPGEAVGRGAGVVLKLHGFLMEHLTPAGRKYLEKTFDRRGFVGAFEDKLIELCLEQDPVAILMSLFSNPDLVALIEELGGAAEGAQLEDREGLSRLILERLGFRRSGTPAGICQVIANLEAGRMRMMQASTTTEVRGCVLEAGQQGERVLQDLVLFYGTLLLPHPFEVYIREQGWNASGKPVRVLTLGQLFEVLRRFGQAIEDRSPPELAARFAELFPGRDRLLGDTTADTGVLSRVRNDVVHYRERAGVEDLYSLRSYADRMFGQLLLLLEHFQEHRIYPRVVCVRKYVEDAYGRRWIDVVDDAGEEQHVFTDQVLEPAHSYLMHPTTNPIRIFPILVRLS